MPDLANNEEMAEYYEARGSLLHFYWILNKLFCQVVLFTEINERTGPGR